MDKIERFGPFWQSNFALKVRILHFLTTSTQVYTRAIFLPYWHGGVKITFYYRPINAHIDKVVLTKFIIGCRIVWDLICGTLWFFNSITENATGGRKSAILPNWCCLLSITVLFTQPWYWSWAKNVVLHNMSKFATKVRSY